MEKLIIDRSKWRTGGSDAHMNFTGTGDTLLVNDQGFMCCLGFECLRIGLTHQDINGVPTPEEVEAWKEENHLVSSIEPDDDDPFPKYWKDNLFTEKAININDDSSISSEEREKRIKEHFATKDVEVEFINEYIKPKGDDIK